MSTAHQTNNLKPKILEYFQLKFTNQIISPELKLSALGFESIDYIQLAAYLLKTTQRWLDCSKINRDMTIADIEANLLTLQPLPPSPKNNVRLDELQHHAYAAQFSGQECNRVTYVIHYLQLQKHVNLLRLVDAIVATLNNHFILHCKIIRFKEELYLTASEPQKEILLKSSILNSHFFSQRDIKKLAITVYSERLASIYLQKKKGQYYLIINFHHIVLDGWGHKLVQEEIFRRYAGLPVKKSNFIDEIAALNSINARSMNEPSVTDELRAIYHTIDPNQYHNLNSLFAEELEMQHSCLVISKEELVLYAKQYHLEGYPESTIFTFMMYQMISQAAGRSKILLYVTLSNRFLPIPGIIELVGNTAVGLPLFLDKAKDSWQEFGQKIDELLNIYFKHMSYGAIVRLLLEGDTLLNKYVAPFELPYHLLLTYTNNITKLIYDENPITSNYVNWNNSKSYFDYPNKRLFCDIHDMGPNCFVHFHSRMTRGAHHFLFSHFMVKHFPQAVKEMNG